jgi:hypothetical protein
MPIEQGDHRRLTLAWLGLRSLAGKHVSPMIRYTPAIHHNRRRIRPSPTTTLFDGVHLALVDTIEATSCTISADCSNDREGEAERVVTACRWAGVAVVFPLRTKRDVSAGYRNA